MTRACSPELVDKKGAFQSGSLGGGKSVEEGIRCCAAAAATATAAASEHLCCRNIKLISERSVALSKYFSQLCTLPQVVTSQPFQSFFEVAAAGGVWLCCAVCVMCFRVVLC